MCLIFFIQSSVEGHLGWFYFLDMIVYSTSWNSVEIKMDMHTSLRLRVLWAPAYERYG